MTRSTRQKFWQRQRQDDHPARVDVSAISPARRPRRSRDSYRTWRGLENPEAEKPTRFIAAEWEQSYSRWWGALSVGYRAWRWARRWIGQTWIELRAAPMETSAEVVVSLLLAAFGFEGIRRAVEGIPGGVWFIGGVTLASIALGVLRRYRIRAKTATGVVDFMDHINAINSINRKHLREHEQGHDGSAADTKHTVELILEAIRKAARSVLSIPGGVQLHANLMVRMSVELEGYPNVGWDGCGVVAYSQTQPAEPSWTRLLIPDLGAGEAFRYGQVRVVEDTHDPIWCGLFRNSRTRSFVCLPVQDRRNRIVAVVNIDSTRPATFTRKLAREKLFPAISVVLDMLSDVLLYTTRDQPKEAVDE